MNENMAFFPRVTRDDAKLGPERSFQNSPTARSEKIFLTPRTHSNAILCALLSLKKSRNTGSTPFEPEPGLGSFAEILGPSLLINETTFLIHDFLGFISTKSTKIIIIFTALILKIVQIHNLTFFPSRKEGNGYWLKCDTSTH